MSSLGLWLWPGVTCLGAGLRREGMLNCNTLLEGKCMPSVCACLHGGEAAASDPRSSGGAREPGSFSVPSTGMAGRESVLLGRAAAFCIHSPSILQ